jgi:hypothetical protein
MSSNCDDSAQFCYYGCCDRYGECPSSASKCYYYYTDDNTDNGGGLSSGAIVGIVLGSIAGAVLLLFLVWLWCAQRKRKKFVKREAQIR